MKEQRPAYDLTASAMPEPSNSAVSSPTKQLKIAASARFGWEKLPYLAVDVKSIFDLG